MAKGITTLNWIALILLIAGGFNWGLIGLFNFDLVQFITFGTNFLTKTVYVLVGVSSIYSIGRLLMKGRF